MCFYLSKSLSLSAPLTKEAKGRDFWLERREHPAAAAATHNMSSYGLRCLNGTKKILQSRLLLAARRAASIQRGSLRCRQMESCVLFGHGRVDKGLRFVVVVSYIKPLIRFGRRTDRLRLLLFLSLSSLLCNSCITLSRPGK